MRTLKSSFTLKGNGLMYNKPAIFEVNPSDKKGIRFHINGGTIEADADNVVSTEHFVVLADVKNGAKTKIALVEHFMAACAFYGIDALDVNVESEGFETPITDGSAKVWAEEFKKAGFLGEPDETKALEAPILFSTGKSSIVLIPSDKTIITYAVNFNHPDLRQRWVSVDPETNADEIIEARTFGYLKDLETYQKMGISLGVNYDNTVGLTDEGYTTDLRSEFEPVKHKMLDIIGDLYLSGFNPLKINAKIIALEAGHGYHLQVARALKRAINS